MTLAANYTRRLPALIKAGKHSAFIEPLVNPGKVYVAGAGHVGLAVAELAVYVDFKAIVLGDRREFAISERFPDREEL